MKCCVVIPARYASTRLPGKPLVTLLGKPMILHVASLAAEAVGQDHVYVATDDARISSVVQEAGFKVLMTKSDALTGTDRVAEAATMVDYDIYLNVQGDEPLLNPKDIMACIETKIKNPNYVINGFCWIQEDENPQNPNIPKVITDENGNLVYMSRTALPGFKDPKHAPLRYKKQVCIYGYDKSELDLFASFGRKSALEACEDIEILRFFELNRKVHLYECQSGSLAVDVYDDIEKVEAALRKIG